MARKTLEKREDLKLRLIEAARNRIAADGLSNLRARDVTQDVGCALGGLYTVFADLDDLVIHVNSATLKALEASLTLAEVRITPQPTGCAISHGAICALRSPIAIYGKRCSTIGLRMIAPAPNGIWKSICS